MKKHCFLLTAAFPCLAEAFVPLLSKASPSRMMSVRSVGFVPASKSVESLHREEGCSILSPIESQIIKISMLSYIASMCISLPLSLLPVWALHKAGLITKLQREEIALEVGERCAKTLLTIIPFCKVNVRPYDFEPVPPIPTVWCANHVSALDTFLWLATDEKVRGKHKRHLKVIYWKGLEDNPVCKILFHNAGFIPVEMTNNGSGNPNEYNRKSFKNMIKLTKEAFQDGYDLFLFPEGQLNPSPEKGLLPVFPGTYALARLADRPIRFVGIHGTHNLWHADDNIGMSIKTKTEVSIRTFRPFTRELESGQDFVDTFNAVLGHFERTGEDLPEKVLNRWLGDIQ